MTIVERPWENKETPWCTVCLVTAIVICHATVLYGNLGTAWSLNGIGTSTDGWSGVGLELSAALHTELDELMVNVTGAMTDSINATMIIQDLVDLLLGLTGHAADNVASASVTTAMSLLQLQHIHHVTQHRYASGAPLGAISGIIRGTVDQVIDQLMTEVYAKIEKLIATIKPALEKVGSFIVRFGEQVQDQLESFSVTFDRAQKVFDQVMTIMSAKGGSFDHLLYNTFGLFDYNNTGTITAGELSLTAQTYRISALEGNKSVQLVNKYDRDNSGDLDKKEFRLMTEDSSIPDILSVVLRSYSARLTEISGILARSQYRDEVSQNVVTYLQLMGAKNMTKVSWICERLTNASLPISFTSDVMVQLALQEDNPNVMTTADIGLVIISTMLSLNLPYTMNCYEQLSDAVYWHAEGYDPEDQAVVIERVTKWITQGSLTSASLLLQSWSEEEVVAGEGPRAVMLEQEVLDAMPMIAKRLATARMEAHVAKLRAEQQAHYNQLYASKTAQVMLLHLLNGVHAADTSSTNSNAARVVKSGVPAAPETLEFAKWLSWNASETADRFQGYCFDNTATSSNAIDSFSTMIGGMVKKIQLFTNQMEKYSSPEGIQEIEEKVQNFFDRGLTDATKVIKRSVGNVFNDSIPIIKDAVHTAIYEAGNSLGHMIGSALGTPMGLVLKPVISNIFGNLTGQHSDAADQLSESFSGMFSGKLSEVSGDALGKILGNVMEQLMTEALDDASGALRLSSSSSFSSSSLWSSSSSSSSDSWSLSSPSLLQVSVAELSGLLHVNAKQKNMTAEAKDIETFKKQLGEAVQHTERALQFARAAKKGDAAEHHALRSDMQALQRSLHESRLMRVRRANSSCGVEGGCILPSEASVMATSQSELEKDDTDVVSDAWLGMTQLLKSFINVLPLATMSLKFSRKAVSGLSKQLDSIFILFAERGSRIFDKIASIWRIVFIVYFCFIAPLTCVMVLYGFWAGGYFGGPGSPPSDVQAAKYTGFCGKLQACCDACCSCVRNSHDRPICFWSILICLQSLLLMLFIICLVFVLLTGIRMFAAAGCVQIYILGDDIICGQALLSVRSFLSSFMGTASEDSFDEICAKDHLLLCRMIGEKMKMSGILTSAGSFLAAVLSLQLLIESSILHTRAVFRRRLAEQAIKEESEFTS